MDIELGEAQAQCLIDGGDEEMAAAAVETGKVTGSELRPIARLHAPREQRIEHEGSRGRQCKATLGAAARRNSALHPCRDALEIVAVAPEALRPEIIGRTMCAQRIEFQLQLFARPRHIAQADAEAVARQRAAPEFTQIGAHLEYPEFSRTHTDPRFG